MPYSSGSRRHPARAGGQGGLAPGWWERTAGAVLLAVLLGLGSGCATTALDTARAYYYGGRPDQAVAALSGKPPERDHVLFLMERGMARQAAGDYQGSADDFILAERILDELETYSVSKGGASLVVNDTVENYRGSPYERTLLHTFTAEDHMALGHWNDAGVEGRRIIRSLSDGVRGPYPDIPYARYMAGLCLEVSDDLSNARQQYRLASELLPNLEINPLTGFIRPAQPSTNAYDTAVEKNPAWPPHVGPELLCFVAMGRSGVGQGRVGPARTGYAEFYVDGRYLGRSYPLADTADLARITKQLQATQKSVKTASRVAIKEALAAAAENQSNEAGGDLVRLILIGLLERPDLRQWSTLPRWLQVARMPCPAGLTGYNVVFKNARGHTVRGAEVTQPLKKYRNLWVSFCRDIEFRKANDERGTMSDER